MTVLTDSVSGLTGIDDNTPFTFSAPNLRSNFAGTGIVTTIGIEYTAVNGVLTTDDLDPGAAQVMINNTVYPITIPSSTTPVALWPLIAAG